jgi:uncharacterized GH25 family protein
MRPLPVILLLLVLASALVAGLLFVVRGEAPRAGVASADHPSASAPARPAPAPASLDASGAESTDPGRSATAAAVPSPAAPAAVSATKAAPGVALSGRVLGRLGGPVEGATVYAAESNEWLGAGLDELEPGPGSPIHRVETRTDKDGRFQVRVEARSKVALALRAEGFAPLDREVSLSSLERDLGDLVLDPSVVLAGRVVDSSGRPVEGARIARVSGSDPSFLFFGGPRGATVAKTDAQGAFRVAQLGAGPWHLLVTHDDHPDHVEKGETDRAGAVVTDLVFTLEDGAQIQGRVVGAPAGLAPKLRVRAVPRGGEEGVAADAPQPFGAAARTAACGPDGAFTLRGLKPGRTYRLTAQESTRDFFRGSRSTPVTAQTGDRGVELAFQPETAIVFQAVDGKSGQPVTDLSVQAGYSFPMPLMDEQGRPVRRFPEGRVRYGALPSAPRSGGAGSTAQGLKLRVEAAGYQVLDRDDVAVVEGQDNDLGVVRLDPAPVVSVLVLDDATGAPVAQASVGLVEDRGSNEGDHRSVSFSTDDEDSGDVEAFAPGSAQRAKTGADGRASVTSLPGKTVRLAVRGEGYAKYRSEPIALPMEESLERTVRLSVGGSVTVEVVDSRGAPVSGAAVDHEAPSGSSGEISFGGADARSDAEGKIVFDHLADGTHRFKLRQGSGAGVVSVGGARAVVRRASRGGGGGEAGWSAVEVDGHTAATVRLVAPERGTLAGRVSEGGKPLANASLRLTPTSEDELPMFFQDGGRNTRTDGRGEYLFDGAEEGEYTLHVEHASRAMAFESAARVRAGENRLDLDLPVAIVEGTVTGEDGKPVAGVRVRCERAPSNDGKRRATGISVMVMSDGGDEPEVTVGTGAGAGSTVSTDADGRYSLRGVLADVDLVVEAEGKDAQPAKSSAFSVKPDGVKRNVDLRLERGGAIQVSVQHAGGSAAGGYLARATLVGGDPAPKVQVVGPGGGTKFTGLKPGKWRVAVDPMGGLGNSGDSAIPEREVEVVVGETAQASFDVP